MAIKFHESIIPLRKKFPHLDDRLFDTSKPIRVLRLSVKEPWFTLMVTGEKPEKDMEFRKPGKWIESRLFEKSSLVSGVKDVAREYDFVEFTNGYGNHRPAALLKYEGFGTGYNNHYKYSNGAEITPDAKDYAIFLGPVVLISNIVKKEKNEQKRDT